MTIAPLRERGQKKRKRIEKPIRVYRRWRLFGEREWTPYFNKFATVEQAEAWIAKEMRSFRSIPREDFRIELLPKGK